jgi:hypothetical protein
MNLEQRLDQGLAILFQRGEITADEIIACQSELASLRTASTANRSVQLTTALRAIGDERPMCGYVYLPNEDADLLAATLTAWLSPIESHGVRLALEWLEKDCPAHLRPQLALLEQVWGTLQARNRIIGYLIGRYAPEADTAAVIVEAEDALEIPEPHRIPWFEGEIA